ncbi:MAG: hypothetical protein LBN22_03525 [Clostridiales Family XIII bacterium]|jgi:hypothetical protein|nr:hypothetical protein [Clostridiales Family XIII bacterium]
MKKAYNRTYGWSGDVPPEAVGYTSCDNQWTGWLYVWDEEALIADGYTICDMSRYDGR